MYDLLIVDDEWVIREGLTKTVPWNDWNINIIGAATNGEEALHILQQHRVDILLTDIRMPGLNGLELVEKSKILLPNMKIILLTGHDEFTYAQTALKLGADDFILKPTNVDELKKVMLEITEKLDAESAEENDLITLLIQNMIKEYSSEYIDKIKSFDKLKAKFGFIKIETDNDSILLPHESNRLLIENTNENRIYLYFGIKSEIHWEQIITSLKDALDPSFQSNLIAASLLTDHLSELRHIYKQAKIASTVMYEGPNVTIYKYEDANHRLDMEKALLYIDKHISEPIMLSDLAKEFHMSSGYFSKLFKKYTSMNFTEFITTKRLNMAKELLKTTDLKSFEIAHQVGYTESRYFNQLFKKHVGCTPIEYRNKHGDMVREE